MSAKILAVDDVPANLVALRAVLDGFGAQNITTASSGEEALGFLLRDEFAVVLLDIMMPGMTGIEVARMMRARKRTEAIPIIFLTAQEPNREAILTGYLEAGAADYIVKPFDPDVLRAKVRVFLELHRARESARALARQQERAARAEREIRRLRALVMNAPLAVAVIRRDHVVEIANRRFCQYAHREDVEGRSVDDMFPELLALSPATLLDELFANPRPHSAPAFPVMLDRNGDGNRVESYFDFSVEPMRDDDDGDLKMLISALDVTDHITARRARDEFLSVASHELKTPLTTLRLQCDTAKRALSRHGFTAEDAERRLDVIDRQVYRLEAMVTDFLDISRIAAGRLPLSLEEFDLASLTHEVIERLTLQLQAARCRVHIDGDVGVVGYWDRARLDQVVTNLLTNAMKYGRGAPIAVALRTDGEIVRLSIRDEGVGISIEDQRRIFERFERAGTDRRIGGGGVGLWIVARIVSAHGGTIRVQSARAQGSTFIVELPRRTRTTVGQGVAAP